MCENYQIGAPILKRATSTKLILTNIPTVQYSTKDPSGTLHEPNFPTIVCSYLASGYCCLVVVGLFQPC